MRRRLEAFIPIVLFSIVVQLLAPIGAFRAVAHAVSDPLYMATICSGMASSQDASQTTTPPHRSTAPIAAASVVSAMAAPLRSIRLR